MWAYFYQQVVLEGQKFALGPVVVVGLELEKKKKRRIQS
jgi:hypothetical protein